MSTVEDETIADMDSGHRKRNKLFDLDLETSQSRTHFVAINRRVAASRSWKILLLMPHRRLCARSSAIRTRSITMRACSRNIVSNFFSGEFIDYYEDLDGDNLPEDYKELYDYYNYYNENVRTSIQGHC